MLTLEDFVNSLTEEQDKLVQMGTIKSTKDQFIVASVLNQGKGNNNPKYSKKQHKKKYENPIFYNGGLNPRKDKGKKKEKTKCTYCHKGWNPANGCMNKTIDMTV